MPDNAITAAMDALPEQFRIAVYYSEVGRRRCIEWKSAGSEQAAQLSSSAVEPGNHGSNWGAHDLSDLPAPEAFAPPAASACDPTFQRQIPSHSPRGDFNDPPGGLHARGLRRVLGRHPASGPRTAARSGRSPGRGPVAELRRHDHAHATEYVATLTSS